MDVPYNYPPGQGSKRNRRKQWQKQLGPRQQQFKQQHRAVQDKANLGPYFSSLEEMRATNKQRTRQHFGSGPGSRQKFRRPPRSTPKTVPRAPEHPQPAALAPGANPLDTPAPEMVAAADVAAAADKLEAEGLNSGLDFYGTNEGLLSMFRPRGGDSASEQSDLEAPSGEDEDYQAHQHGLMQGGGPGASTAARLAEQEAYISTLEDENLRLRERLEMLQQELKDLRHGGGNPERADSGSGGWSHGGHSEDVHSIAHDSADAHPALGQQAAKGTVETEQAPGPSDDTWSRESR